MKNLKIIVLVLLVVTGIAILLIYNTIISDDYVKNGAIDLVDTQLSMDGVISLDGEWEFHSNQLLYPDDFQNQELLVSDYITVPSTWGNLSGGAQTAQRGCGTYRLTVNNVVARKQYGIIKKNIRIASRIFVDGKLIMVDGNPAQDETDEIMGNSSHVVTFSPESDSTEIIIQVSNFKYYSGGIVETIRFGFADDVIGENTRNIIFESIIFAVVIAIGVMYGILAFLYPYARKKDKASVLLPFAVIMFAVVNGSLSERIIQHIFPMITTRALIRIEYAAIALLFISLFSAIHFMEHKLLPQKLTHVAQFIYGVLLLTAIFAPMKYPVIWTIFTYIITMILAFGFIFVLIKYLVRDEIGLCIEEHTFILVLLYTMNIYNLDVYMFTFGHKTDMNIALISTAVYGTIWLVWILYRYIVEHKENEKLSVQLIENHYAMERTSRSAKRSEMAFLQAQIKPHFLFNSLSSILSLQRTSPERAEKMLQSLSEYLKDLFDVDISADYIHIENELNIVQAYVNIEKERFGDRIDVQFDIDPDAVSCKIIPLLIQPLVENAMRHGALKRETGGAVRLSIKRADEYIFIVVEDNGPGFSKQAISEAKKNKASIERKGIGVNNIIYRLEYYYGEELKIEDKEEGGARISFRVPVLEEEENSAKDSDC